MTTDTWPADGDSSGELSDSGDPLDALLEAWEAARESGRPVRLEDLSDDAQLIRRARLFVRATLAFERFRKPGKPSETDPPSQIGPYEVLTWLDSGASCDVFHCRHIELARHAAVKLYKSTAWPGWNLGQFKREIEHLVNLNHRGIVQIYDAGKLVHAGETRPWFAMELVHGAQLDQYLASLQGERTRTERCLQVFADVCQAVAHAHRAGIVHCDLKFQNILVDESDQAKVIDFGIGLLHKVRADQSSVPIRAAGTLPYMAPERFGDPATARDVRSDVYSLGVVLYRMFTGHYPYEVGRRTYGEWKKTTAESAPTPPRRHNHRIDADLEAIILKAIAKSPDERYLSVEQLAEDVRRFREGWPVVARPVGPVSQLSHWASRNKAFATSVTLALVALVAASTAAVFYARQASRRAAHLQEITRIAESSRKKAVRYSRELEDAQKELSDRVERLRYSTTNMTLWLASANVESDPMLARAALTDPMLCAPEDRGFVWRLLEKRTRTTFAATKAHEGSVYRLAVSADGQTLLSSGADGLLRTWVLPELRPIGQYRAKVSATSDIAISPDGRRVLLINHDGEAVCIDLIKGHHHYLLHTPRITATLGVFCSRSGRIAVAASDGIVRVWDAAGAAVIDRWQIEEQDIVAIRFGSGGRLAAVTRKGAILLRDVDAHMELSRDATPLKMVGWAAFDGTLRHVLLVRPPRRLLVWDRVGHAVIEDETRPRPLSSHIIAGVLLGESPPRAIVADRHAVQFAGDGLQVFRMKGGNKISAVAALPAQSRIVVGDESGMVFVNAIDPPVVQHRRRLGDASLRLLEFDHQHRLLFAGFPLPAVLEICDYDGHTVRRIAYPQDERLVALLPIAGSMAAVTQATDGTVRLWNPCETDQPEVIAKLDHRITVNGIIPAGDGDTWVGITRAGTLLQWHRPSNSWIETPRVSRGFRAIVFAPRRDLLAVTNDMGRVGLVDADKLTVIRFPRVDGNNKIVACSPASDVVVTAGHEGVIRVLRLPELEVIRHLRLHTTRVTKVSFSPDGKLLASAAGDGQVILWDTRIWEPRCRLRLGSTPLSTLQFSSDGDCLAVGDKSGTLTLWNVSD